MRHLESKEQCAVIEWARYYVKWYPCLKWLHSSQSGVKLNALQGAIAKREGMIAGIPDLFLPYPSQGYAGLFIEMKRPKSNKNTQKGTLSPAQKECLEYLNSVGYKALVCYGANEAISAIKEYLGM